MIEATFSPCRKYRYTWLTRWDGSRPNVAFVGLNPSTADEHHSDPTVRRCIDFAKRFGGGSLCMLNLFAYRSTDPRGLYEVEDPIGRPDNLDAIERHCRTFAGLVVCAWGTHGRTVKPEHAMDVEALLYRITLDQPRGPAVCCLGWNKDASPKHPLYRKAETWPVGLWSGKPWGGFPQG